MGAVGGPAQKSEFRPSSARNSPYQVPLPSPPIMKLTGTGHGQWVMGCPEVAFLAFTVGGPLIRWQSVCWTWHAEALRYFGLERSRDTGWWAQGPTTSGQQGC